MSAFDPRYTEVTEKMHNAMQGHNSIEMFSIYFSVPPMLLSKASKIVYFNVPP